MTFECDTHRLSFDFIQSLSVSCGFVQYSKLGHNTTFTVIMKVRNENMTQVVRSGSILYTLLLSIGRCLVVQRVAWFPFIPTNGRSFSGFPQFRPRITNEYNLWNKQSKIIVTVTLTFDFCSKYFQRLYWFGWKHLGFQNVQCRSCCGFLNLFESQYCTADMCLV